MQSSLKALAVAACVSALTATFLAGPAAAAESTLVLSIKDQDALLLPESRTLGCDRHPWVTTGSHPRRKQACDALHRARGNFGNLGSTGAFCPMIYQPVTVSATGRYRGMKINFKAVHSNACVAAADTADIFRF
ncbi:MAG: SSI family serine proteinase inhibitor [Kibdelosporangium sp.]